MVDRDVALRKSEAIEHHASRLRAKLPLRAAGLRNLIVHRYGELVTAMLVEAIATGLDDLDDFATALRAHAGSSQRPARS